MVRLLMLVSRAPFRQCRGWAEAGVVAAAILAVLCGCARAQAGDTRCRNVLFKMHWSVRDGSLQTLTPLPDFHTNLRLCPAFNGQPSCCRQTFEEEQSLHFDFWRQVFMSKLQHLRANEAATQAIELTDEYNAATPQDREQLRRALHAYTAVLEPRGHAVCFASLLSYAAGMLCFACDPAWGEKVQFIMGKPIRVHVADTTCTSLWASCEHFASLARSLRQLVLDSRLAGGQSQPMENLDMFSGQQDLCDWAHDSIAMHPFTTPGEAEREATPPQKDMDRRLALGPPVQSSQHPLPEASSTLSKGSALSGAVATTTTWAPSLVEFEAIKAGRASGFDITWGGVASAPSHAVPRSRPGLLLVLLALIPAAFAALHGSAISCAVD